MTPLFFTKPVYKVEYDRRTIGTTVFECPDASDFYMGLKPNFEYRTWNVTLSGVNGHVPASISEFGYRRFEVRNLSPGIQHLSAVFEGYSNEEIIVMKDAYQYSISSENIIADILFGFNYPIGQKETLSDFTMTAKYKDSTTNEVLSTVNYEIGTVGKRIQAGVVNFTCTWESTTPQEDPIPSKIRFAGKSNNMPASWNSATFLGTSLSAVCPLVGTHEEPTISYKPYRYVAPIDLIVKKTSYGYV